VDGFGAFFGDDHAQMVKGCTSYTIQHVFCDHLYSFLLNGISSISLDGDVLNIMNVSGKNICKGMGTNRILALTNMRYIFHDLDLITFHFLILHNNMTKLYYKDMVHMLEIKLKKSREQLVARLNKKLRDAAPHSTPQQLSALLNFRTPPAVLRLQRSEKNVPEVNVTQSILLYK
jgi:hypothetical protein